MFCPHKNSYLQLVCAINPRVINKAVDHGMERPQSDLRAELPPPQRLESMQPSIYCPHVDITRSALGYGRIGLRLLNRDLYSSDHLVLVQAVHTLLDQVQISEHAIFLINLHVVYRLTDLMKNNNPIIREKVCLIYTLLSSYYQGREQIMKRPIIIDNLMWVIINDKKEIRYVAAYTLWTLTRYHTTREMLMKTESIVLNLLKMIKSDHVEIAIFHLKTVSRLTEHNAEPCLRSNGFEIMRKLFHAQEPRVVAAAMNVMTQMCKHAVGRKLADKHYMTWKVKKYLYSPHIEVITAAVGLLQYTSITTAVKFRAREFFTEIVNLLLHLCHMQSNPHLQLQSMQTLINLCDCPDIRCYMKAHWIENVKSIRIQTPEQWDGSSETQGGLGLDTGHHYRTVYVEQVESIHNAFDGNVDTVNVHNYVKKLNDLKDHLIQAMKRMPYKD